MMENFQTLRRLLTAGRFDVIDNTVFSNTEVNKAAVESGQALGFQFDVIDDPLTELMDSMEELSLQFEEKTMKTMGERRLGELRSPRSAFFTAVETWQKILPDMPGGAYMEKLLRQLRQLAQLEGRTTPNEILRRMAEGSRDPSVQYAMLDALAKALGPDEAELAKAIDAAKRELMRSKGPEVRAGLNLANAVNETAKNPAEMQGLRDLYRGEVLGFKNPQSCFRSLIDSRGPGKLGEAIEFLLKGCGLDLQSASPSQSPEELRRILSDLQCVQVLKTCYDKLDALAGKMALQFGEPCLLNGEQLTDRVMEFTQMPFVSPANVAALISSCGLAQLLAQIYFCTGLIDVFRQLSPRLFDQEADRFQLEDAAQEHLDGLIVRQEDEEQKKKDSNRGAA